MKHMKGIATWVTAFIFAVALIVVYKTFDNFSAIWGFISNLLNIISPFVFGFGLAFLLYAPCSKFESLFKRTQKRFLTKHARGISLRSYISFALCCRCCSPLHYRLLSAAS